MCDHERQEEMLGIVLCTSCGLETEKFFGFSRSVKPKSKLEKTMEAYEFPTDVTKEAIKIYKKFYGPIRKTIVFGCFCVAYQGNEPKIREKMGLKEKLAEKGLKDVLEKINGCW